jgi:aminopeptidase N
MEQEDASMRKLTGACFFGTRAARGIFFLLLILLPGLVWASEPLGKAPLDYRLDVSFDLATSTITGVARIPMAAGQELRAEVGTLRITSVTLEGRPMAFTARSEALVLTPGTRGGTVEIRYQGTFRRLSGGSEETPSVIGDDGIFLSGAWYPKPQGLCAYHLTARLPEGFEAVSEAETITRAVEGGTTLFAFAFPHPVDGINLVATSRYRVAKEVFKGVEVWTYFFPEDADLVGTYQRQTKRYLELYTTLIGPFPFRRFSIVENFLPTGYSMPTYTLLGRQVVRLPFIPETSLGHEILHQWFGNLVYVDYEKGNWAEGLTTFLADHLYEAEKGHGADYRKEALVGYMSYVNERNEFPLRDFKGRSDQASQAIGYGKATMVFQMLRSLVGDERFFRSLRHLTEKMRFRKASWDDIRRAFEEGSDEDLRPFFRRWIDEKGLVGLTVSNPEVKTSGTTYELLFDLGQDGKGLLSVPVSVYYEGGKVSRNVRLSREKERVSVTANGFPYRIVVDEDYELARRLTAEELPAVIARLLGDEKRLVVAAPASKGETYKAVSDFFLAKGDRLVQPERAAHDDLKSHSLVILDADNPLARELFAGGNRGGLAITVKENPWNAQRVAAVFDASSKRQADLAFPKITHYGTSSLLSFDEGKNTLKRTNEAARGIVQEVSGKVAGIDLSMLKSLPAIVERVCGRKVIYVGEAHDRFSHHLVQLEVIKDLRRRGRKVAIGMEMFQRPFQKALDDYIGGTIDEKTFLKEPQYFPRWIFDYRLYRPILLYARSEKIPVVALNQKTEIIDKVSRGGLESLSDAERRSLPAEMDFSDEAYRERLKGIFHLHEGFQKNAFDFFYQAQVLWDETMAESIDGFLKTHGDYQMVVLAGSGHIAQGSGIPKRAARRNGYDYVTILMEVDLEPGIADFVLFPAPIPGGKAPQLQVQLKESPGGVTIEGFPEDSASKKAGLRVGDMLLSIDGAPIRAVEDLKIELLSRTKGDKTRLKVSRKGLFGVREVEFEVVLQ